MWVGLRAACDSASLLGCRREEPDCPNNHPNKRCGEHGMQCPANPGEEVDQEAQHCDEPADHEGSAEEPIGAVARLHLAAA